MQYAMDSPQDIFPINTGSYKELSQEYISRTDQLIYRFSQLQDTIGNELEGLAEYTPNMPFIDILNKLEKLSIIDSAEQWFSLREIRNLVIHEYSGNEQEMVHALNELHQQAQVLHSTLDNLLVYIKHRNWL
jgi:uncharacterized protein with HEPN domain